MSNQEPDGWCAWHPEKGFADPNDREENLREVMDYLEPHEHGLTSTALREGWEIKPVMLIDPQELSRLRAIDEWAEWAARELREVYSSTDKPHILKAYDALTEAKP